MKHRRYRGRFLRKHKHLPLWLWLIPASLLVIGLVLIKHWRLFTRDEDIAEIEQNETIRREMAQNRQPIDVHYILRQVKGLFRKQA